MNKLDFTNDLLTKQLTKLKDEALKPMSIIEIQEKFNLSFPFRVKRVKQSIESKTGIVFPLSTITQITMHPLLGWITNNYLTNHDGHLSYQCAEVQDYILFEEN